MKWAILQKLLNLLNIWIQLNNFTDIQNEKAIVTDGFFVVYKIDKDFPKYIQSG
jgi:hypothetical protein